MKIEQAIKPYTAILHLLRCPRCFAALHITGGSLLCANGHCYDVSTRGTLNFAPDAKQSKYDKTLFESRTSVLENGFYDGLMEIIKQLLAAHAPKNQTILDAGCGEGYYSARLQTHYAAFGQRPNCFGVDLSKDAIALAAKRGVPPLFFVADLAKLPFCDASADVILNILSPAHYAEFARVLKPNGVLIKIAPGDAYLCELRAGLNASKHSSGPVRTHFEANNDVINMQEYKATLPINAGQRVDFATMTPLTFGIDATKADLSAVNEITLDFHIMTGRPKNK